MRILLLGGTTEASRMARALAETGLPSVFSYAGRTAAPVAQPLPVRVGGFGGAEGLAAYIRAEGISHVIDTTHPFAAQMSRNAVEACDATGTALVALERAPWVAGPGDRWIRVPSVEAAAEALPEAPARVFLAIGRLHLAAFAGRPQHHYLLRLVDPPEALPLPQAQAVIARGPFTLAEDLDLLRRHGTEWIVAKNAGGEGARAKLDAARELGLPVVLIDRPAIPPRPRAETPEAVLAWLAHPADLGV
ncbi:cobalt-precorrin-6A reductase [Cereibacter sediminicola]|uniref:cobalt-precorrin-6A reductase n=1 Tax=Cereibacter sediminicola TaxID=2584941 RepID=UPI0011A94FA2|nr:cobalt-precorrin-6A reductase [Cereibacter sediminicola]